MAPNVGFVYGSFLFGDCKDDIQTIKDQFPGIEGLECGEPTAGNDFDFNSLKDMKFLVLCTSSKLGYPPENFTQFAHQLLLAAKNPEKPLKHLQHAVFGNGDGSDEYRKTYMNMPRYMDLLLEKAGSRRFYYRGEASVTEGKPMLPGTKMGEEAEPWAKEMWKAAAEAKVDAPMVQWGETWKVRNTAVHKKVTEWDSAALNEERGPLTQPPSMFAKL
jgi:hypothetical protein